MKKHKHTTLCFECEWAGGKDKKCPWACKFEPVPGWKATPTVINGNGKSYTSFDVYECPSFELMHEIKEGIVARFGKVPSKNRTDDRKFVYEKIKEMRSKGASVYEIADSLYYSVSTVAKILKSIMESEENDETI